MSLSLSLIYAVTLDDALISYGPLGIGVLVLGYFAAKQVIFLRERGDKAEAQRDAMIEDVFTKVLPALTRNTEVLDKRTDLDREIIETLRETTDVLRELSGQRVTPTRRRTT